MWRTVGRLTPRWAAVKPFIIVGLLTVFVFTMYFWRLSSMTSGLGPDEYSTRHDSQNLAQIINRGVNAPYLLAQHFFVNIVPDETLALRGASVFFALIVLTCLFFLLRAWFGTLIAVFGSLIFATTPWVVLTSRTASPDIMYLWPIVIMTAFIAVVRSKRFTGLWWILFCVSAGLGLYVPGVAWFLIAAVLLARRWFGNVSERLGSAVIITGLIIGALVVIPLVFSLVADPFRIKTMLLIPEQWAGVVESLKSVGWSAAAFFWQTRYTVDVGIGRLPILNVLQIVLLLFGAYALRLRAPHIAYFLIGVLVIVVLVAGINSDPSLLTLSLPAVAVFVTAGLRYLYLEWRRVFPRNPFSYALALALICAVVGAHMLYGLRYSLVAWPKTESTKKTFVLK